MRPLALFDAAAFCFGPASTLQIVLEELLDYELDLVVLCSGTTAEFLKGSSGRCTLLPCDSEEPAELARWKDLFQRCDVFVSNTNPVSARYALELGVPTIYVDTLFWMWDEIDPVIARSAAYVAQTFAGIEENRRRIGGEIANFRIVGPLAGQAPRRARARHCLISYGGMASKFTVPGVTNSYAWVMTRLLLEAFERAPTFDRYLFRGSGPVMEALAREFCDSRCEFAFAPRIQHLDEMASARNLLLSPGLTGSYEAIGAGTPTWLLPPQNYSQQLQSETFLGLAKAPFEGRHWGQIYPDLSLRRYMPEEEGVALVSAAVRRFEDDAAGRRQYVEALVEVLPLTRPPAIPADAPFRGEGAAAEVAGMILQATGLASPA
jgi:hypothetical protein